MGKKTSTHSDENDNGDVDSDAGSLARALPPRLVVVGLDVGVSLFELNDTHDAYLLEASRGVRGYRSPEVDELRSKNVIGRREEAEGRWDGGVGAE
jgi:hypothetical protein